MTAHDCALHLLALLADFPWLALVDMKLAHHYRVLGLRRSASFGDVKKAYRQLVRQYHPDINPDKAAIDRFIKINAAYTALCEVLQLAPQQETAAEEIERPATSSTDKPPERLNLQELKLKLEKMGLGNFQQDKPQTTPAEVPTQDIFQNARTPDTPQAAQRQPSQETIAASAEDLSLKQEAYSQLKMLLRQQKFPRAIALVEGLAHRMPTDPEVTQWQAIVYQRWGRALISQGQFQKARLYLKKALQTDPHNPSLGKEVSRDLGLLKHLQAAEATL